MTQSSENNGFTIADIERYHAGQMQPAERHALEKAAMEDPFLADALEGYAYTATPALDIRNLKARLAQQGGEKKAVPFLFRQYNWLKAAAVILVVAGGSWLAVLMLDNEKRTVAEDRRPAEQQKSTPLQRQVTDTAKNADFSPNMTPGAPVTTETYRKDLNAPVQTAPTEPAFKWESSGNVVAQERSDSLAVAAPENKINYQPAIDQTIASRTNNNNNINWQNNVDPSRNRAMPDINNNNVPRPPANNNTNIQNQPRDYSTYYKDNEDALKKQKFAAGDTIRNLNIVLQPSDEKLSEVVVSSGPVAKRKIPQARLDTLEPTIGWTKFDEYVANNLNVPEELKTKEALSGEVELSFEINKSGEPVNITVTRSLCQKCDEEAIRLLKEGPKWKKKKKHKKGKVTIRF